MIQAETMYYAVCAICGNQEEHPDGFNVIHESHEACEVSIQNSDWLIGGGEEAGVKGEVYCPNCFTLDDKDKAIIGPREL